MGLMVALLLVIGPIDYLLVHKLFNRPELTWITFPLIRRGGGRLGRLVGHIGQGESAAFQSARHRRRRYGLGRDADVRSCSVAL